LAEEYGKLMMDNIDEISEGRFRNMNWIEEEKLQEAKVYNRRVRENRFKLVT
jgi:hypothetical protein